MAAGTEGVQMKRQGREEYVLEGKGIAGGEQRVLGALGGNGDLEKEEGKGKGSAGGSEGQVKVGCR